MAVRARHSMLRRGGERRDSAGGVRKSLLCSGVVLYGEVS